MHKTIFVALLVVAAVAHAQGTASVQRSSSPQGVRIQGDTMINANVQNTNAVAAGENNAAKTATGAVKGGTQIQGNTKINANARNVNAIAVGKGNAAANDVGAIGDGK
ncbi:MAG: hypothetical protein A2040_02665 [Rhodocyclales bacterium GWA2_65_19]|nr:MAG: hypothetical protein A2040_02665 [Rhodocyclales bacterium GWA2_65_19]